MSGIEPLMIALSLGSAASGVVGAISSANAQAASANYNAAVQERNAVIADQNRVQALRTAQTDAEDQRRENRRMLASMRAGFGANGFSMAGSPLDALEDAATEAELDARRIQYEGRASARQSQLQGIGAQDSAALSRMEARNAKRAGYTGAATSLLSSASQFAMGPGRSLFAGG